MRMSFIGHIASSIMTVLRRNGSQHKLELKKEAEIRWKCDLHEANKITRVLL